MKTNPSERAHILSMHLEIHNHMPPAEIIQMAADGFGLKLGKTWCDGPAVFVQIDNVRLIANKNRAWLSR